jgi:hypothetical protein
MATRSSATTLRGSSCAPVTSRTAHSTSAGSTRTHPTSPAQPTYTSSCSGSHPPEPKYALAAQEAVATFLDSNGTETIDPDGAWPLFEAPITGALPGPHSRARLPSPSPAAYTRPRQRHCSQIEPDSTRPVWPRRACRAITVADLRAVNLFDPLDHAQFACWARVATRRAAAAGEIWIEQGDRAMLGQAGVDRCRPNGRRNATHLPKGQ